MYVCMYVCMYACMHVCMYGFVTWSLEFESQPLEYKIRLSILRFRKTRISHACASTNLVN